MNFASDNISGAAPQILARLVETNALNTLPYGGDEHTRAVEDRFREVFETELEVVLVPTGTAANALALAGVARDFGAVFCRSGAHIASNEAGAVEFLTGGASLVTIEGEHGKLSAGALADAIRAHDASARFRKPTAASIAQATELGTVYTPDEIAALASVAHENGMRLHVDGARWANALATLGVSPAEMSWRAGVDVLSLGATKNGAIAAEAVIFFDPALAEGAHERRKRAGMLLSKHRFLSLQFEAFFEDGLWLDLARRANARAAKLADGLSAVPGIEIIHPVQVNEVFASLPAGMADLLEKAGAQFYRRPGSVIRLVTSFATREEDVDALIRAAQEAARRE